MEKPGRDSQKKTTNSAFNEFVMAKPDLSALADHPLTLEQVEETFEHDPFNFRYKLGPVYHILRYKNPQVQDKDIRTPLTILISGGWGTGKTSAMRWLEALLTKWSDQANPDDIKFRPIWFYPWKYDKKEDVWRGLIAEVILHAMNREADAKGIVEALKIAALFIGKSALDLTSAAELQLGPIKLSGKCLKQIRKNLKDAVYPEKQYLQSYEQIIKDWIAKSLKKNERMVIFIDDLDRCMPEIGLQVLEALKLYLSIKQLIFVVGVDRNVVETLVVEHYKKLGLVQNIEKDESDNEENQKQRKREEEKAKQYLSKMFQVEVELSPSQEQIRDFLKDQLSKIPLWQKKLSTERKSLFRGIVLKLSDRNPREVKRILNSSLMAGAGTEMMKSEASFEQGLQDYFIRKILQRTYPSLAPMINTDTGRAFLGEWSQFVLEHKSDEGLRDVLPDYISLDELFTKEDK
jgi:hypothetical protein